MPNRIKFKTVLSLKRIATIKMAILLWNRIRSPPRISFWQFEEWWLKIEDEIKESVFLLKLPKLLEGELKCLVKPIGLEILKWLAYHGENIHISVDLIDQFHWTTRGTINKQETAQLLVKNQVTVTTTHYNLACICCLEGNIPSLWCKMPDSERIHFWTSFCPDPLSIFWTYKLSGDNDDMKKFIRKRLGHNRYSLYHSAFLVAAESGNAAGTEYFWPKLTFKERNESLVPTARKIASKASSESELTEFERGHYADVLCFLLSHMNEEEQTKVFKGDTFGVLFLLIEWPWQDFLVKTLNRMWSFLLERDHHSLGNEFYSLLETIARKEMVDCENCVYRQLFTKLWQITPVEIRKVVANMWPNEVLLCILFGNKDLRNIKLILGEASANTKRDVLFSGFGIIICEQLIEVNEWDLLEFFIDECSSSEKEVVKFKERFFEFNDSCENLNRFVQMLSTVIDRIKDKNCKR